MGKIKSKRLRKGLTQLCMMQPFWGTLALHMEFVADDREIWPNGEPGTLRTDGKRIFYSTKFCDSLSVGLNCFCIAHEVSHPFLGHLDRPFRPRPGDTRTWGKTKDGKVWHYHPAVYNVAGDQVINLMLEDAGFQIWPKAYHDKKYKGMTTEKVYGLLLPPNPPPPPPSGGGKGKPGDSGDQQGDSPSPQHADGNDPASGAGYDPIPGYDPITGNDIDASEGPAEDFNPQEFKEIVTKAAAIAKAQGKLPASIAHMVKEATEPQYPVYLLLDRFVDSAIKDEDYSWHRPHRDFMAQGIIMPSLHTERISHVVLVYDVSGSVSNEQLARFHRIGGDIIRRLQPQLLSVVQCDASIKPGGWIDVKGRADWPKEIKITGRGGTSFKPPFEEVRKRRVQPSCLVYLTDLEGSFPDRRPNYPVLWISTTKHKAPWGTTIHFNDAE